MSSSLFSLRDVVTLGASFSGFVALAITPAIVAQRPGATLIEIVGTSAAIGAIIFTAGSIFGVLLHSIVQ